MAAYGRDRMIELSDRDGTGSINADVVAAGLAAASAEIDTYLRGVARLPLPDPPPVLKRLAVDLAYVHMLADRAGENDRAIRGEAIALLDKIVAGKIKLGLDALASQTAGHSVQVLYPDHRRWGTFGSPVGGPPLRDPHGSL